MNHVFLRVRPATAGLAAALALALAVVTWGGSPALAQPVYRLHWRQAYETHLRGSTYMVGVAATGPRAAWAAGVRASSGSGYVLHWNGLHWRMMKRLPAKFLLGSVDASSPANVWVFGTYGTRTAAERWNGSSWRLVPIPQPDPTQSGECGSTAVVSAQDAWCLDGTALLHWNGRSWVMTGRDRPDSYANLAVTPGGQVWRVGIGRFSGHPSRLLAYRWNRGRWIRVRMPHPAVVGSVPGHLSGLSISIWSGHDIWIGANIAHRRYLVLHYNGRRWAEMVVPRWAIAGDVIAAGGGRLWVSPYALWNGRRWLEAKGGPQGSSLLGYQGTMTAVPRTDALLAVATVVNSRGTTLGEIWRNGRLP